MSVRCPNNVGRAVQTGANLKEETISSCVGLLMCEYVASHVNGHFNYERVASPTSSPGGREEEKPWERGWWHHHKQ